ncbi:hypothetical protein TUBRATIS_006980 [Tubulinosema ratisbonensis]|uniref:Uncharacterized protein n=1 Tax=Tubulinosema ratisbonensis TaxID=291195 RepID=A0A437ANM7_9MICR|nr:hypothetical protein TUBRATIS_006980 [Tubulinosema ratisbonensis]
MFFLIYLTILLFLITISVQSPVQQIRDNLLEKLYKKYSSVTVLIIYSLITRKTLHLPLLLILFIPLPQKKIFSGHVYKTILITYFLVKAYLFTNNTFFRILGIIFILFINFYVFKTIFYFHNKKELLFGWILGTLVIYLINYLISL